MLFFSAILLSLFQFAFLAYDPNDPCFYGVNYCLNRDGSTKCVNSVVHASFRANHGDNEEWLTVSLIAKNTEQDKKPKTISIGFTVEGKPYNLYCSTDDDKHKDGHATVWDQFDFSCNFKLSLTASNKQNPVTNTSISIDLATDDNVPVTLGYNGVKGVVASSLKETLFHKLSYLECYQENRMSFTDNDKKNRVMMMKKVNNQGMETFIYGLAPDTKPTDRSVKFANADGVSLTVSCNKSFGSLTGFVQKGGKKESIDNLFTFKSLDGYRCGFKLPTVVQANGIKFDFNSRPLNFSFSSTSGSSINKPDIKFHTDKRNWPDLSKIDWDTYNPEDK